METDCSFVRSPRLLMYPSRAGGRAGAHGRCVETVPVRRCFDTGEVGRPTGAGDARGEYMGLGNGRLAGGRLKVRDRL